MIQEIIKNEFEDDLLPIYDVHNDKKTYDMIRCLCKTLSVLQDKLNNKLNAVANLCDICETDVNDIIQHCDNMVKAFEKNYHIFSILSQKMKHPRHGELKSPLSEPMMLALIIYCNGDCTYDLTESQRIQKDWYSDKQYFNFKWYHFDFLLNYAIKTLSHYENHFENIYTGLCHVSLTYKSTSVFRGCVHLKTNASFTTDLEVAKEFRASNGMIICVNMQLLLAYKQEAFKACDVSWISEYPDEKEILVTRFSWINLNARKIFRSNDNQWIIADDREITTKKIMCSDAFPGEII